MRRWLLSAALVLVAAPPALAYRTAAWFVTSDSRSLASLQQNAGRLHEVNPVWYKLREDGTFEEDPAATNPTWRAAMSGADVLPLFRNAPDKAGMMVAQAVLMSPDASARAADAIVSTVIRRGYDGAEIDFEWMQFSARAPFTAFLESLAARLHREGKVLSVTLHPKQGETMRDGPGSQDWPRIGQIADRVKIMAYDYSWGTSPPGPIAPLQWLANTAAYAAETLPPHKITFALPWYGYDWKDGRAALPMFHQDAVEKARVEGRNPERDANGELVFRFRAHTIYYQDAESFARKVSVLRNYRIGGFAIWRPGGEDPDMWSLVEQLHASGEGAVVQPAQSRRRAVRAGAVTPVSSGSWAVAFAVAAIVVAVAAAYRLRRRSRSAPRSN